MQITNRKTILLVLCALLMSGFAMGGNLYKENTIVAPDGRTRYFHYYVPAKSGPFAPLVILLHGGTQDYNRILRPNSAQSEWMELADEKGFYLLIPNGINAESGDPMGSKQHWNDCRKDADRVETGADDVGFIRVLIDWATRKFDLDTRRVYVVGASNGGMMAYRLAFELPHKIAAIAAYVANLPENGECRDPERPIPVLICNGSEDRWMPWRGGSVINGGLVMSAYKTRDFWIRLNHAGVVPIQTRHYPDIDRSDESKVRSDLYRRDADENEVVFYTVDGGGHSIPSIDHEMGTAAEWLVGKQNHDIEIVRHTWAFFSRHARS